ncbi:MAG TPA: hypothetical protein VNS58_11955 [Puia sp.]|nr:hypothetical protein [Puia sp.]
MNNRLEQFVRDHRGEFDDEEPGKQVWEDIRFQIEPGKQRPVDNTSKNTDPSDNTRSKSDQGIIRLNSVRWSAAAAIILVMAGSIWFFKHKDDNQSVLAARQNPTATPAQNQGRQPAAPDTLSAAPHTSPSSGGTRESLAATESRDSKEPANATASGDADANINEEMYHYARLVELKHKELKTIEKDEPLLYKQFAADVHDLDSVYQSLQKELPKNPNREQLLEAMLQNLQLQMGLLNHQLDIIKQINHSKKTAYEKAYKTA